MSVTADPPQNLLLPKSLEKGDTIGIVAPAGPVQNEEIFHKGVQLLQELGYEVKFSRTILRRTGYLAGSDIERAQEFEAFWLDPDVKMLMAMRGGYGSMRILPFLNMDICRQQPKLLVGFSDISILLSAIHKETGLVTFHGPMLTTLPQNNKESVHACFDILSQRTPHNLQSKNLEILVSGSAAGKLIGGNLASLTHLLGTSYDFSWENSILFLEDVHEAPYRIDRMLTHLKAAGKLDQLNGIILGQFMDCGDIEVIWERLLNLVNSKVPVWGNFPVGHGEQNHTLPIGIQVEMDGNSGTLRLPEAYLS